MNPRAEAMLTAREQTASNNEGYARLEAIRPLQRKRSERVKRSLWVWLGLGAIATPWLMIWGAIDTALHFFHVPHWCVIVRAWIGG